MDRVSRSWYGYGTNILWKSMKYLCCTMFWPCQILCINYDHVLKCDSHINITGKQGCRHRIFCPTEARSSAVLYWGAFLFTTRSSAKNGYQQHSLYLWPFYLVCTWYGKNGLSWLFFFGTCDNDLRNQNGGICRFCTSLYMICMSPSRSSNFLAIWYGHCMFTAHHTGLILKCSPIRLNTKHFRSWTR